MKTLKYIGVMGLYLVAASSVCVADRNRPNIILIMADDLGYGDTGFNGNKVIKTPHLDTMAKAGVILTNFHAGGPVCSPTRGTCLTGRHYQRYGIISANVAHLPKQEITIPEILKEKGYATGHFGKWHLGTLSKTMSAKGKKRKPAVNYSPPSVHGYDRSFVTESAVATWNPGKGKQAKDNPFYDDGVAVDPNEKSLEGGSSRVVMDRAIPFIRKAVSDDKPFFTVIWFHAPHEDVIAGPDYRAMYKEYSDGQQHYYGCITELDEQVGRLRKELKELGVTDNTMLWFTSDNGPEGRKIGGRRQGTTDGLRGRKRSLFEGGVRVPSLVEWPGHVKAGTVNNSLMSTLDYFPTISELIGYTMSDSRPIDGESILDVITGTVRKRFKAIPFCFRGKAALIDGDHKYWTTLGLDEHELYNFADDRPEKKNLAKKYPERLSDMKMRVTAFLESAKKSHSGADYNDPSYKPVEKWRVGGEWKLKQMKNRKGNK